MKAITRRLRRLEDQFGPADGKPRSLLVVCKAGWGLALDRDRCIQILGEGGFLPSHGFSAVYLCDIPDGLNADELEQYLREHGAESNLPVGPSKRWASIRRGTRESCDYEPAIAK